MIPTIQNPIFKCSRCGKEEEQKGVVATGIPDYWVCRECRGKMKKITVTHTIYEDGFSEFGGDCDFCKQFPCEHVGPDGKISAELGDYRIIQGSIMKVKAK